MTDPKCTCPIKDGKRQQCADGQTIKAYNCPVHGVPKPVKREEDCRRKLDEDWWCANTQRDHAAIDVLEGAAWCAFCGGRIIIGDGTIQPAPGASPSP